MEAKLIKMSTMNQLFRKRINFTGEVTFENLEMILDKMAKTVPFENVCVIEKKVNEITKENLIHKLLEKNEGGLCYELNTILYYFLQENGFKVSLFRAVIYNASTDTWVQTGRTHVAILLTYNGSDYLIDTGYGGNLPLKPVPFTGEVVHSENGSFRVTREASEHGDHLFEMKLNHKDNDWKVGYAFNSEDFIKDQSELDQVQQVICESEYSPFNKDLLITKLVDGGNYTLTSNSFTIRKDGKVMKEEVDANQFQRFAKEYFNRDIHLR